MKDLIYLASPYSHPDDNVKTARYMRAIEMEAKLLRLGFNVFSPIAHSHGADQFLRSMSSNTSFYASVSVDWMQLDRVIFDHCTRVFVLRIDGWEISKGVREELEWAAEQGKPVFLVSFSRDNGIVIDELAAGAKTQGEAQVPAI